MRRRSGWDPAEWKGEGLPPLQPPADDAGEGLPPLAAPPRQGIQHQQSCRAMEGLPPIDAEQILHSTPQHQPRQSSMVEGAPTSPRKMLRFSDHVDHFRPRPRPTLQRRDSLKAYDPIIVTFVKNGDKFFEGVRMNITGRNARNWDTLLAELSRRIELPAGVRQIYTPKRGHKVKSLTQLEHQKMYVCGSTEPFKKIDYDKLKNPNWKTVSRVQNSDADIKSLSTRSFPLSPCDPTASLNASIRSSLSLNASTRTLSESGLNSGTRIIRIPRRQRPDHRLTSISEPEEVMLMRSHPRNALPSISEPVILTLFKNGPPPRQTVTVFMDKTLVKSWEAAKQLICENVRGINGSLRLFTLEGEEIQSLSQLWRAGSTFVAAGNEKFDVMDFLKGAAQDEDIVSSTHDQNVPAEDSSIHTESSAVNLLNINRKLSGETKVTVPEGHRSEGKGATNTSSDDPEPKISKDSHPQDEKLDLESNHSTDSRSEPSIIAKGPVCVEASSTQGCHNPKDMPHIEEPTTTEEEKDTSGEVAEEKKTEKREQRKLDSGETTGNEAHANMFSDSSGADDANSTYNTQHGSTISAPYLAFPPTPHDEGAGRRPRPRRLSTLFDSIRPISNVSSTAVSPLLQAKSPRHRIVGLSSPQTPQSDISVVPSLVDMAIAANKEKTFYQSSESLISNFSVGSRNPVLKSRNVAIQTNCVDDHLSLIVEPDAVDNSDWTRSEQSLGTSAAQKDPSEPDLDLEASAAASQLHKLTREKYSVGMAIASGCFASVKQCSEKEDGRNYLLRVVYKARAFGQDDKLLQEVEIMRLIRHENVLTVQDYWESSSEICMVMEPIEGGDLFDAILRCQHFSEADAMEAVRQLGLALVYLHANRIVHREVKPENIFISLEEEGMWTLKLAGFSLATRVSEPLTLVCGNEHYRAPEMITGKGYGTKADVWSAGVIAYILLSGIMPFRKRKKLSDTLPRKFSFPSAYWENVSNNAKDFICRLLVVSPQERYSSSHLMQHAWLKQSLAEQRDPELSRKLMEYLTDKAALKVSPVPMLTVTTLDHESHVTKKRRKFSKIQE